MIHYKSFNVTDLALERNRQFYQQDIEKTKRARFLSSTLQQLTSEHESNLSELQSKFIQKDIEFQSLSQKLTSASDEVEQSHLAYKVIEAKLLEERSVREQYDFLQL